MTPDALPKVAELEAEFSSLAYRDGKASWYEAIDLIKRQIAWLEYVPEHELKQSEVERLMLAAQRTYVVLRSLTARYID